MASTRPGALAARFRTPVPNCLNCGRELTTEGYQRYGFCSRWCNEDLGGPFADTPALEPKTCPECHERFQPQRATQTYCSRSCAARAGVEKRRRLERACDLCGTPFHPAGTRQKYCSRACANYAYHDEKANQALEWETVSGETITTVPATTNLAELIARRKQQFVARQQARPVNVIDDWHLACPACGHRFKPTFGDQVYCSARCASIHNETVPLK